MKAPHTFAPAPAWREAVDVGHREATDAAERARKVRDLYANRPNYDGLSDHTFYRYFTGYMGEWAASNWLTAHGIPHAYNRIFSHHGTGPEIKAGGMLVEVKTLSWKREDFVIGGKRRLDAHVFLVVRSELPFVDAGKFEIAGWFTHAEVITAPVGTNHYGSATRSLDLAHTHAPAELINLLKTKAK